SGDRASSCCQAASCTPRSPQSRSSPVGTTSREGRPSTRIHVALSTSGLPVRHSPTGALVSRASSGARVPVPRSGTAPVVAVATGAYAVRLTELSDPLSGVLLHAAVSAVIPPSRATATTRGTAGTGTDRTLLTAVP